MAANTQGTANRNPLDHVLPQGYLDGFTSPSEQGQLWVFDREEQRWFDTGTPGVAAIRGFYDYPPGSQPDQTADEAFHQLEARFPTVRRELVHSGFSNWRKHLDFLLEFAQMLRARSDLFRQEDMAYSRSQAMFTVTDVSPGNQLSLRPFQPADQKEYGTLLRNKAITDMRLEISRGAGWLREFNWCVLLASNPTDPVITGDNPVIVDGIAPSLEEALQDARTVVSFPICWQACLVGRKARFDKQTDAFQSGELKRLRTIYVQEASRFVYSPSRISSLSAHEPHS